MYIVVAYTVLLTKPEVLNIILHATVLDIRFNTTLGMNKFHLAFDLVKYYIP